MGSVPSTWCSTHDLDGLSLGMSRSPRHRRLRPRGFLAQIRAGVLGPYIVSV